MHERWGGAALLVPSHTGRQPKRTCVKAGFVALAAMITGMQIAPVEAAEAYPGRPVRMIVPFPPGGGADILARIMGEKLTDLWGQQVIIDNRGGAGGTIGTGVAARGLPDGYTLLMASSNHPINAGLFPKLPYDVVESFTSVSLVASAPLILVVNPGVPAQSVSQLVELARSRPGTLTFGSAGNASTPHLAGELFNTLAQVSTVHVPYKGSAQALTDLLGGQLSVSFNNILSVVQHVKSGKLRALAVTSTKRSPLLSDLPTVSEAGVPKYEVIQWWGILGPAKVPGNVVAKLRSDVTRIIGQAHTRERFASQGVDPASETPEQFRAFMIDEVRKWGQVIKAANVRID